MSRPTHTGTAPDIVNCRTCGWHYEGKNGLGLAAQHHDKYGHTVDVDTFGFVTYGDLEEEHRYDPSPPRDPKEAVRRLHGEERGEGE